MRNKPTGTYPNDPTTEDETTDFKFSDLDNVEIEDVDTKDYPDFCDAFFSYAEISGRPLTEEELIELGENYPDELNEIAHEYHI